MKNINKQELENAIHFISKLSEGIDPISGIKLSEDTVLNNRKYLQAFSYASEFLRLLKSYNKKGKVVYLNQLISHVPATEIQKVVISKTPIPISEFTYNINIIIDSLGMKKIKATQITWWLTEKGYLKEDEEGKTTHKICTNKAVEIGIHTVEKRNEHNKEYYVTLYNDTAQKYILDNFNDILDYCS